MNYNTKYLNIPISKVAIDLAYHNIRYNVFYNVLMRVAKLYKGGDPILLRRIIEDIALKHSKSIYYGDICGISGQACFSYGMAEFVQHTLQRYMVIAELEWNISGIISERYER